MSDIAWERDLRRVIELWRRIRDKEREVLELKEEMNLMQQQFLDAHPGIKERVVLDGFACIPHKKTVRRVRDIDLSLIRRHAGSAADDIYEDLRVPEQTTVVKPITFARLRKVIKDMEIVNAIWNDPSIARVERFIDIKPAAATGQEHEDEAA